MSANGKTKNKTDKLKILCAVFDEKNQILTCGLSNGTITQFLNQKFNNKVYYYLILEII